MPSEEYQPDGEQTQQGDQELLRPKVCVEKAFIPLTDTVAKPWTVMVVGCYTVLTFAAVFSP
jgi:hypothetical protein